MKTNQECIESLKKMFPEGSTVYCVLRNISRSGMQREIGFVSITPYPYRNFPSHFTRDQYSLSEIELTTLHPNYAIADVLGMKINQRGDGVKVRGCGMDMGFHVVSNLAHKLYGKDNALRTEWL